MFSLVVASVLLVSIVGSLIYFVPVTDETAVSVTESSHQPAVNSKQSKPEDAAAQYALGIRYLNGDGVAPIKSEAIKWLTLAAQQGHIEAQLELTDTYEHYDPSNPAELKQAARWLRQAADLGQAKAQFLFGRMYAEGRGVIQDFQQAAEWLQKAANAGNHEAMYHLGMMHVSGDGVEKDHVKAYVWFNLAAAEGNQLAFSTRTEISGLLSTEQLSEAQTRSREWQATPSDKENASQ